MVSIADFLRVNKMFREKDDDFIVRFKKMRNKCKIVIPEVEFIRMAKKGLDMELRKIF